MSNNIYNILGKLKGITDNAALTPDTEATTVYESVDARGSITEAVKSLEAKYQTFKEAAAKPDFLDVDKDGDKAEPFKKAVKDKNNAKGAFKDMFGGDAKDLTSKLKIKEGMDDLTDLDSYQFADPDTDTAIKPATAKQAAAEKRRRLQDIEDRRAEKDDWFSGKDAEPNVRIHQAKYQDEPEELDELTTATGGVVTKQGNVTTHKGKKYGGEEEQDRREKDIMDRKDRYNVVDVGDDEDLDEVAPPGAKAERMVKHIKKGYAKDGKLTDKEKAIAYATTWAAHNKGQVEEGVEFKDAGKIKNSAANMKKAKLAKVTESRVMEETDYFYEQVAKALCEKNPNLNTAGSEFADAVRKEMVAQGIQPNRARNILLMDEDFLGDVATSYSHYCKEVAECGAPMNSHLGGVSELDEIAALAGLPAPMQEADIQHEIGLERSSLEELDESTINEAASRKDFRMVADLIKNIPDEAKRKELAQHHADIFKQQNPRFSHDKFYAAAGVVNEAEMAEGNEFSGALAAAKASGAKEFEVAGKRYTVKEDINVNITANGEEDALNLFRKLAGMQPTVAVQNPKSDVRDVEMIPVDAESAIAQGIIEPVEVEIVDAVDEERDPEYVNSPREQTAGIDAAIPSGNDLHATKRAYKIAQPGDNPMAVAETKDTSWSKYTSLLKGLLK